MNRNGEIIVIEDDEDDRLFLEDIFTSLDYPNKVVYFMDPTSVIEYLSDEKVVPFLILSDINMPKMDGYELREKILLDKKLGQKCIPYIFLSTSKAAMNVEKAYLYSVQGYFEKQFDFNKYQDMIKSIVEYWKHSLTPLKAN
jgi:CheY-like chemotaxis protein